MLIIKPYGRSQTNNQQASEAAQQQQQRQRQLLRKTGAKAEAISVLEAESNFLMAQWISVIDKIIRKNEFSIEDKGDSENNEMAFRNKQNSKRKVIFKIQHAARAQIGKYARTHGLTLSDEQLKVWEWKLHPYDQTKLEQAVPDRIDIRGRWYKTFVGDIPPASIDAAKAKEIAEKIHKHLTTAAQRKNIEPISEHPKGRINHQLASISANVHSIEHVAAPEFADFVWENYFTKGDVVKNIYDQVNTNYPKNDYKDKGNISAKNVKPSTPKLSDRETIATALYAHYAKVFGPETKVKDLLNEQHEKHALWQLHSAIKATYKAMFDNASVAGSKKLHQRLPRDKEAMRRLMRHRSNNQDLGHLVRLGKVIHYEAASSGQTVRAAWQAIAPKIEGSQYWLSDGQAEIKRSEALVRVFKQAITHAAHSLVQISGWDENKENNDILLEAKKAAETSNPETVQQQFAVLFGREAKELFPSTFAPDGRTSEPIQTMLKQSIEAWAQLRHASFHFKGKQAFLDNLKSGLSDKTDQPAPKELDETARQLWQQDWCKRLQRIKDTLQGIGCENYLTQPQLLQVYEAVARPEQMRQGATLDLPRLNRVLARVDNIRKNKENGSDAGAQQESEAEKCLPKPAKREALEQSEPLRCQYVLLKLLYEQDFSGWLQRKELGMKEIRKWIQHAIGRSEADAKRNAINGQPPETIHAKANKLWQQIEIKPSHPTSLIAQFFHELAAATASEFRVQRYYESDPESAKAQASFIDNLKCDVIACAFSKYLKANWEFLLQNLAAKGTPSSIKELPMACTIPAQEQEKWVQRLYFLLHMVPVGVVSQLLHQLRKWQVLSGDEQGAQQIYDAQLAMVLYLDMHDAKFDGGIGLELNEAHRQQLEKLFERQNDFETYFPKSGKTNSYIPLRALREMLRFGGANKLEPIFATKKITAKDCKKWGDLQGTIAVEQKNRQNLHAQWVKEGKGFSEGNAKLYDAALQSCTEHRHLAHRIRLIDHVQLHSLLMAVLARLADYAGLWERDLYFVTLALCHSHEVDLPSVFSHEKNYLDGGQIVEALRKRNEPPQIDVNEALKKLFGATFLCGDLVRIRNALSHFNMLRSKNNSDPNSIHLTDWVNQTRQLMAYDRKLKNAVSKSIVKMLKREGFIIEWKIKSCDPSHLLVLNKIESDQIKHFDGKKVKTDERKSSNNHGNSPNTKKEAITEKHHSDDYCAMVQQLFGKGYSASDHTKPG